MIFADGMQLIVENIEAARENRISDLEQLNREVAHIQSDARADLASFERIRRRNAADLRRNLQSTVNTNRMTVRNFLQNAHQERMIVARETHENLRDFNGMVKSDVTNIRIDANNMVHLFAEERMSRSIALYQMLKSFTDGMTSEVEGMMDDFGKERSEVVADLKKGQQGWQWHIQKDLRKARPESKAVPIEHELPKKEPEKEPGDALQEEILTLVLKSPKGISLTEAGKELDIEWRKLIAPAKRLLKEGLIRKDESHYFPVS